MIFVITSGQSAAYVKELMGYNLYLQTPKINENIL